MCGFTSDFPSAVVPNGGRRIMQLGQSLKNSPKLGPLARLGTYDLVNCPVLDVLLVLFYHILIQLPSVFVLTTLLIDVHYSRYLPMRILSSPFSFGAFLFLSSLLRVK